LLNPEEFSKKELKLPFFLFKNVRFNRSVAKRVKKDKNEFVIIGTHASFDLPFKQSKEQKDFYKFLFDTGLGEKNSFGFGFMNPL
jgi:CRISPR-associated endoribonuclease Cas6